MKSRHILGTLVLLSMVFVVMCGCSKKQEPAPAKETPVAKPAVQAVAPESPLPPEVTRPIEEAVRSIEPAETPISPAMEQFLAQVARKRQWAAGQSIKDLFAAWQDMLQKQPRNPMTIHFEVQVDQTLAQDVTCMGKSNRQFLDEFCQAHNLLWTITGTDTIRIGKKPQ